MSGSERVTKRWGGVYYGWLIVATVTLMLAVTSGGRFVFGVVLKPVSDEFGWSRTDLATAVTINVILLSILQPIIGLAVSRWGSRRILLLGVVATAIMMVPLSLATHLWQIYVFYGIVAAFAFAATSPVNVTALVSGWFTKRRGLALSIATSGSAIGQLAIVPLATWIMVTWSWRTSYWVLAGVALLAMLPLGWLLVRDAPPGTTDDPDTPPDDAPAAGDKSLVAGCAPVALPVVSIRQAIRTPAYWQLSFGFFGCGYTMSFTSVHMIPYMLDMSEHSFHTMETVASTALSVVGGCSILGAVVIGLLADRIGRKPMLATTYFLRGLAFLMLVLAGPNLVGIFLAAIVLGISWTSTTPLTSAISADMYGRHSLAGIFGFMFSTMNIGSAAGAWLAARDYDITGNYHLSLIVNAFLGFAAAAVVQAVRERSFAPPLPQPAALDESAQPALSIVGDD
ncbi:MAG: MFS transporter [Thermomicrobiales bacterium]